MSTLPGKRHADISVCCSIVEAVERIGILLNMPFSERDGDLPIQMGAKCSANSRFRNLL
jgi:hypothetical protein